MFTIPYSADPLYEHVGLDRERPAVQNIREWPRVYGGLPTQRKMPNCDVYVKNRPQHGREAEAAQSSLSETESFVSAPLKG